MSHDIGDVLTHDTTPSAVVVVPTSVAGQEDERQEAIAVCQQASKLAALECMTAFGGTDFREDLAQVKVPTLVIHGDTDATVPFEGSGQRTHEAIAGSELVVVNGGPHGVNISHAAEFNQALISFLSR